MFSFLPPAIRGILALLIYVFNTLFWFPWLMILGILKLILPFRPLRKVMNWIIDALATNWISINGFAQRLVGEMQLEVTGLDNLPPQSWYLVISNHQTWVDILILQMMFNRRIPFIKFFLKKELMWVPIMGLCWWALDFPFMQRYSQAYLKKHPEHKGKDIETTRKACEKYRDLPVSVMNFVEGTRFTPKKHQQQGSPYQHLLRPKAGGVAFVLSSMGEQLKQILDVTIYYPDGSPSFWQYLCGQVKTVQIHIRTRPIEPTLIGDYVNDEAFKEHFQHWINQIWDDKEERLIMMATQGKQQGHMNAE